MYCTKCGRRIPDQSKFCSYCAAPVPAAVRKPEGGGAQGGARQTAVKETPASQMPRAEQNIPASQRPSAQQNIPAPQRPNPQQAVPASQRPAAQQNIPASQRPDPQQTVPASQQPKTQQGSQQAQPPEDPGTERRELANESPARTNLLWLIGVITSVLVLIGVGVALFFTLSQERNNGEPDTSEALRAETTAAPAEEDTLPAPATTAAPEEPVVIPDEPALPEEGPVSGTALTYAAGSFKEEFSPFYCEATADTDVVDMVHCRLLATDRSGTVLQGAMGDGGVNVDFRGTTYNYRAPGDVSIRENADGTVDYVLTIRDDLVFSDGVPVTIDDVIFSLYVLCDPAYDGPNYVKDLPIEGLSDYIGDMAPLYQLLSEAGRSNTDYSLWAEQTQFSFWAGLDAAGTKFAQDIIDYCVENYADTYAEYYTGASADEVRADPALQVKLGMNLWGFGSGWSSGATALDFFHVMLEAYDEDLIALSDTEAAKRTLFECMDSRYLVSVSDGSEAPSISGIRKNGPYSVTVRLKSPSYGALSYLNIYVAPLHYYGQEALYDYAGNSFGFPKGDLSHVKSRTASPLGLGPYVFDGYSGGVVSFSANTAYYKGCPKVERFYFKGESGDVYNLANGRYDVLESSGVDVETCAETARSLNRDGELIGDRVAVILTDYSGYGYIGIDASLVNVGGDPDSEASKALRKGFMTLFAVCRAEGIQDYYGDTRAWVPEYPNPCSWLAPQPTDPDYRAAYATDVNGNPIYTSSMTRAECYAAAKEAAVGWFKAAGLSYDASTGKFTNATREWSILIPGYGAGDHPAYEIASRTADLCQELGIRLTIDDVDNKAFWDARDNHTSMMWAAAWGISQNPNLYSTYHSGDSDTYFHLADSRLDSLLREIYNSPDQSTQKTLYRQLVEIVYDWGCELPTYQRRDCVVFSSARIDSDTIPTDLSPYYSWISEAERLRAA